MMNCAHALEKQVIQHKENSFECSNLTLFNAAMFRQLIKNNHLQVVCYDKNMGPAVITNNQLIKFIYDDHLHKTENYTQLTQLEDLTRLTQNKAKCQAIIMKAQIDGVLPDNEI